MFQIPSLDWPRRTSPLVGVEDLLKQNPSTDNAPQEERVPVNLISDFTINQILLNTVGTGVPVLEGKFSNVFKYRSIASASQRATVNLIGSTIQLDVNAVKVANSVSLSDIGDVTNTPTTGEFLKYNGASWITAPLVNEFYITDSTNTEIVDGINDIITFNTLSPNLSIQVANTNNVNFGWTANLADLTDVPSPTVTDSVLIWNGFAYEWSIFDNISHGSVDNGLNVGNLGYGVFVNKLGSLLRFRNISANSNKVSVNLVINDIKIDVSPSNIASEIRLNELLDVTGTAVGGDMLLFNDTTNHWETAPAAAAGVTFTILDQLNFSNTFNSVTDLKVYGDNGIKTNWATSTNLKVSLDAVLNNLNDVSISTPISEQALMYNAATSTWQNTLVQFQLWGNIGKQYIKNDEIFKILGQGGITVQVITPNTALVKLTANLTDLQDIVAPTGSNEVLVWNGMNYVWQTNSVGESNTASNVGTLGTGVFKQKTGANLEFRNIAEGSSKVLTSLDIDNNITIDVVPSEIANEITLESLLNVTNSPSTNAYLKYDGTNWMTDTVNLNFSFSVEADTGTNILLEDGDTHIITGDDLFIGTVNSVSGVTKETQIHLDIYQTAQAIKLEDLGNVFGNPAVDDIIVYNGTDFVFQPKDSQVLTNAWTLNGNSNSAEKKFGTIDNFDIPIITNNIQVGVFKSNGRLGWGVTTPNSTIDFAGSLAMGNVVNKTTDYTLTSSDYMVVANAVGNNIKISLPSASTYYKREYIIKKVDNSQNIVTLESDSFIDGALNFNIYTQYTSIKLKSDGNTWHII
jgi:hypothetical protein